MGGKGGCLADCDGELCWASIGRFYGGRRNELLISFCRQNAENNQPLGVPAARNQWTLVLALLLSILLHSLIFFFCM
jgi:hypothetical protein